MALSKLWKEAFIIHWTFTSWTSINLSKQPLNLSTLFKFINAFLPSKMEAALDSLFRNSTRRQWDSLLRNSQQKKDGVENTAKNWRQIEYHSRIGLPQHVGLTRGVSLGSRGKGPFICVTKYQRSNFIIQISRSIQLASTCFLNGSALVNIRRKALLSSVGFRKRMTSLSPRGMLIEYRSVTS